MLENKIAVVTGGSRGIGREICLELARNGADIAVIYSNGGQQARETADEIKAMGRKAEAYKCDVSGFDATKELVKAVLEDFGGVDILVNNAGITNDRLILSMSESDFDSVIATNLKGAFNMTRHLYSHFMKKRGGRIINITSVAGIMGNAGQANYASAKAGMIGLTKSTAKELASRNVTCNAIAPGFIETDMTKKLGEKAISGAIEHIPLGRMGKPSDIAKMVGFLSGDAGGYITGEVIKIDGGLCI